jgi:hypothetical protein
MNPLALFSKEFGDFICRFCNIEVSESSRELRATIEGGHGQGGQSPFSVIK